MVTVDRQPLLTLPENLERLQQGFHFENQRRSFQIDGLIVLPDHLHCILKLPENDDNYPVRITNIKKFFSMGCKGISAEVTPSRRARVKNRFGRDVIGSIAFVTKKIGKDTWITFITTR